MEFDMTTKSITSVDGLFVYSGETSSNYQDELPYSETISSLNMVLNHCYIEFKEKGDKFLDNVPAELFNSINQLEDLRFLTKFAINPNYQFVSVEHSEAYEKRQVELFFYAFYVRAMQIAYLNELRESQLVGSFNLANALFFIREATKGLREVSDAQYAAKLKLTKAQLTFIAQWLGNSSGNFIKVGLSLYNNFRKLYDKEPSLYDKFYELAITRKLNNGFNKLHLNFPTLKKSYFYTDTMELLPGVSEDAVLDDFVSLFFISNKAKKKDFIASNAMNAMNVTHTTPADVNESGDADSSNDAYGDDFSFYEDAIQSNITQEINALAAESPVTNPYLAEFMIANAILEDKAYKKQFADELIKTIRQLYENNFVALPEDEQEIEFYVKELNEIYLYETSTMYEGSHKEYIIRNDFFSPLLDEKKRRELIEDARSIQMSYIRLTKKLWDENYGALDGFDAMFEPLVFDRAIDHFKRINILLAIGSKYMSARPVKNRRELFSLFLLLVLIPFEPDIFIDFDGEAADYEKENGVLPDDVLYAKLEMAIQYGTDSESKNQMIVPYRFYVYKMKRIILDMLKEGNFKLG
jgi:hypothetical protein